MRATMRPVVMLALVTQAVGGCGDGRETPTAEEIFADSAAARLARAAAAGDTARIRRLVADGANPNARGRSGVTLPQWALMNRSAKGLGGLLDNGADPALADSSGETVMHYAAMANDSAYMEVLLAHGADPNTPHGVTRATPIVPALMANRDVQFRRLLAAGADPNRADRMGNTPLHVAAKILARDRVLDLLRAGADPRATNSTGSTFQRYLARPSPDLLTDAARRDQATIDDWLRAHGVPADTVAGTRKP
jgi:ankyrin repeat protein